jgi:hypothetical protein
MAENPKSSVSYETDRRTGYVVETIVEGILTTRTFISPQELIKRLMKDRPTGVDSQEFMLEIVRKCAQELAPESARSEREALQWFRGYFDGVLASASGGKPYYSVSNYPEEAQIEGIYDASPDAETRAFAVIRKAINASVERMGKYESGNPDDQKKWTPLAKKIARRASVKVVKKSDSFDSEKVREKVETALSKKMELSDISVGIDLDGLARELNLDSDLRAYLQHYGEASRAKLAALLTRETGEVWDAKRLDRARKRFEYHLSEIKAAAPKHLMVTGPFPTPNTVRLKTALGAREGAYMHAVLVDLFFR